MEKKGDGDDDEDDEDGGQSCFPWYSRATLEQMQAIHDDAVRRNKLNETKLNVDFVALYSRPKQAGGLVLTPRAHFPRQKVLWCTGE